MASDSAPTSARPSVAIVTATAGEGENGIGDYARLLCDALNRHEFSAAHVQHDDWSLRGLRQLREALREQNPRLVHLQHPQGLYGWSLAPQLLTLLQPAVVTLHEASRYGPIRGRGRLLPFTVRSPKIVVTSEFERRYVGQFAPWAKSRLEVVPIASNVPPRSDHGRPRARKLVYFGSLRPDRGLEAFLELSTEVVRRIRDVECLIIGSPVPTSVSYAHGIRARFADAPVEWMSGLTHEEVADVLVQCRVAYLPFPDGASERRGSILAALGCGLPVVTSRGRQTTADLASCLALAKGREESISAIEQLATNDEAWRALSERGRKYAARFSWDKIARRHIALYERSIGEMGG
ncbi:MAG: glycosyltransferase family 4 protein [Dehalococcoidia bacterium]